MLVYEYISLYDHYILLSITILYCILSYIIIYDYRLLWSTIDQIDYYMNYKSQVITIHYNRFLYITFWNYILY